MSSNRRSQEHTQPVQDRTRQVVEWITFGISLGLLLLVLGLLTYDYLSHGDDQVLIEVELDFEAMQHRSGKYFLPVEIANEGHQVAENVQVTLLLRQGEQEVDSSSLTINFLPGKDSTRGMAVFDADPTQGEIEIDLSYLTP